MLGWGQSGTEKQWNNVMDLHCSLAAVTDAGLVMMMMCHVQASRADKRVCVCVCVD